MRFMDEGYQWLVFSLSPREPSTKGKPAAIGNAGRTAGGIGQGEGRTRRRAV